MHEPRFRSVANWCILLVFALFGFNIIFSTIFTPLAQHTVHTISPSVNLTEIKPPPVSPTKASPYVQINEDIQAKVKPIKPLKLNLETPKPKELSETEKRRDRIRSAFKHAIGGYLKHGFPSDEIRPVSSKLLLRCSNFLKTKQTILGVDLELPCLIH